MTSTKTFQEIDVSPEKMATCTRKTHSKTCSQVFLQAWFSGWDCSPDLLHSNWVRLRSRTRIRAKAGLQSGPILQFGPSHLMSIKSLLALLQIRYVIKMLMFHGIIQVTCIARHPT